MIQMRKLLTFKLPIIAVAIIALTACSDTPQQPFDSQRWKSGDARIRGSMAQDLIDRKLLMDKSESEVENLLGKPGLNNSGVYDYHVITISRCNFWACYLGVVFDEKSKRVRAVAVND